MKSILSIVVLMFMVSTAQAESFESRAAELRDRASDLTCSVDAECKAVGFTKRACGGFEDHLVYSTAIVDEKSLIADVEQFNHDEFETRKDMMSICSYELPPELACVGGMCQIK